MSTLRTRLAWSLVALTLAAAPLGCASSGTPESPAPEATADEADHPNDLESSTLAKDLGLDADQQTRLTSMREDHGGRGKAKRAGQHGGKRGKHGGKNAAARIERRVAKLTTELGLRPDQQQRLRALLEARAQRVGQGKTDV